MEEGSSEVGSSEKVSLSKVVLVLLAVEVGAVKEGSGFLPSMRVLGRAIKAGVVKASSGSCHQGRCWCGFLKQAKGESTSLPGPHSIHGRCGRQSTPLEISVFVSCSARRSGLGSLRAL